MYALSQAEMSLHARALEMLTSCYHNLLTIDINHDTAELRRALHPEVFETYMTPAKQHKHHRITFRYCSYIQTVAQLSVLTCAPYQVQ